MSVEHPPARQRKGAVTLPNGMRPLMTGEQVDAHLNIGRRKRFELIKQGLLRPIRLGSRTVRFTPDNVDELASE
jgi:predicted DNA-binding transcriptional regulator AlpA